MHDPLSPLSRWIARRMLQRIVGPIGSDGRRAIELEAFGIPVEDPDCRERILGVLRAFFTGFEAAIESPRFAEVGGVKESALFRPFFHEGAAMGFGARSLLRWQSLRSLPRRFEMEAVPAADPFLFLRFVGLGFWLGFRAAGRPRVVERLVEQLAARRVRHLVHDGYGFQVGFFSLLRKPRAVEALRRLDGFGRTSAFNGLGRSLWFFYMDRPEVGFLRARTFGADSDAVIGGMGLAAAFTRIDDLARAYEAADRLPPGERPHFEKGIRIALYCRHANDAEYLASCIAAVPRPVGERARRDLESALEVGDAFCERDEFIAEFHRGCLRAEAGA